MQATFQTGFKVPFTSPYRQTPQYQPRFGMLPPDYYDCSPPLKVDYRGSVSEEFEDKVGEALKMLPTPLLKRLEKTGLKVILAPTWLEGIPYRYHRFLLACRELMNRFLKNKEIQHGNCFAVYHPASHSLIIPEFFKDYTTTSGKLVQSLKPLSVMQIREAVVHEAFHAVDRKLVGLLHSMPAGLKRMNPFIKEPAISLTPPFLEALEKDKAALRQATSEADRHFLAYITQPDEAFAYAATACILPDIVDPEIPVLLKNVKAHIQQNILPVLTTEEKYY